MIINSWARMKEPPKTYILFGPRVSEATKQAVREHFGADEIPADFGPFESGAIHCELFPFFRLDSCLFIGIAIVADAVL